MKASFALFLLFVAGVANADMPNDYFTCNISGTAPDGSLRFSGESSFASVKQSLNASSDPSVRLYSASAAMNVHGQDSDYANLAFNYQQAVLLDATGNPIQAAQYICFSASGDIGHRAVMTACLVPSNDPFGPDHMGWDDATIQGGVPVFLVSQLHPVTLSMPDGSKLDFNCKFEGSSH